MYFLKQWIRRIQGLYVYLGIIRKEQIVLFQRTADILSEKVIELNGCKPGQCYVGDTLLPMQQPPPPPHPPDPPPPLPSMSMMGHYSLAPATSQELPEWGRVQRQTALGTTEFSSRFIPEAIPKEG